MDGSVKRKLPGDFDLTSNESIKALKAPDLPFTVEGKCEDEIQPAFDNGKTLFVSKNFLVLSSPVFEAMFKHDFIEKTAKCVPLPGKCYDDFLEFLLCMNQACLQDVNNSNVLRIVGIAEEYQINSLLAKCKCVIKVLVKKELEGMKKLKSLNVQVALASLKTGLTLLHVALPLSYQDEADDLVRFASRFSSDFYGKIKESGHRASFYHPTLHGECKALFEKLPADVKYKILSKRLFHCDNYKIIQDI